MYTIKFADGSSLSNLTLNGNNFISETPIDTGFFTDDKLKSVEFIGERNATCENMQLIQCVPWEGGSAFILAEIPAEVRRLNAIRSALETNSGDITDIQSAIVELYEMMLGGV